MTQAEWKKDFNDTGLIVSSALVQYVESIRRIKEALEQHGKHFIQSILMKCQMCWRCCTLQRTSVLTGLDSEFLLQGNPSIMIISIQCHVLIVFPSLLPLSFFLVHVFRFLNNCINITT